MRIRLRNSLSIWGDWEVVTESHHFLGFQLSCVPYLLYHESIAIGLFPVLPTKRHVFSLIIDSTLASSKERFQSIFGDCLRKRWNFGFKRWNFKSAKDEISNPEILSPNFINSVIPANSLALILKRLLHIGTSVCCTVIPAESWTESSQ